MSLHFVGAFFLERDEHAVICTCVLVESGMDCLTNSGIDREIIDICALVSIRDRICDKRVMSRRQISVMRKTNI